MPAEMKLRFYVFVTDYGMYDKEPENLTEIEKLIWIPMKDLIDSCKSARGGAPEGNQNAKKTTQNKENNLNNVVIEETTETTLSNDNGNGNGKVKENDNTQSQGEEKPEYIKRLEKCVCAGSRNNGQLTKDLFNIVTAHNSTAARGRTIAIPKDEWTFSNKNMRELLAEIGTEEPAKRILTAIANFTKVARSDTWQKSFTWAMFCKHYNDYTPEFFTLERYLNAEPQTDDASKKPENAFFFAHKDDPEFHVETFQTHIDDWKAEGRPDGADYLALQNKWEAENAD